MASNKGQPTSVRYSVVFYKGAQQQNEAAGGGISNGNGRKPVNDDVADTSSEVDEVDEAPDSSAAQQTKSPVAALLNVVLFFVVAFIVLHFILHEGPEKISTDDGVNEGRHEGSFKEFTDNLYTTQSHSSSFHDMKDKLRAGREELQRKRKEFNEKRRHWSSLNRKKSEQSDDEVQFERWNTGEDGETIEDVHFADDFEIDAQAVNDYGHDHSIDPEEKDRLRDQVEDLNEDEDPEEDRSIPESAYSSYNCQQKPSRPEIYSSTQDDVTHPDVIGDSDRELETESAVEEESKATDISHRDDSVMFATKPDVLSISTVSNDGTRVQETVPTTVTITAMDTRDSVSAQMLPNGESIKVSVGGVDIYIPKDALKAALEE